MTEPLIRSSTGTLPKRIGDLEIVGPPKKVKHDPMVTLRCVHVIDGNVCNKVFTRRLYRITSSYQMCTACVAKERQRPRCKECGSTEHARDKCPRAATRKKKCQTCFGTPDMVEGPFCKECGLAYEEAPLPTARTRVSFEKPAYVAPKVVCSTKLSQIQIDGGTQARVMLDERTIEEYAEAILAGAKFPPPVVYYDGKVYWLGDGFHRVYAYKRIGAKLVECEVRGGGRREAILFAAGANAVHGLKRTNADKHRAVEMLLHDAEWIRNSDRWIAERAAVSDTMVRRIRQRLELQSNRSSKVALPAAPDARPVRTGVDGKVRRLPVRQAPPFSHERARERIEGTLEAVLSGWPESSSLEPLALWLEGAAARVRGIGAERRQSGS